jgi:hypothetical protein
MASKMGDLYRITVQPELDQNIYESRSDEDQIHLTPAQLDGIATMSYALFNGDTVNHLRIIHLNSQRQIVTSQPTLAEPYIVSYNIGNTEMSELLHFLQLGYPWRESLYLTLPGIAPLTKRYSAIFWDILGDQGILVEFDSPQFLQGAITVCQWFNLNWPGFITDLHEGDEMVRVTNMN